MLALDFDGVICDALLECAAVTWYAGHLTPSDVPQNTPDLHHAVQSLTPAFLDTFGSVRPHSRTLQDFMVSTLIPTGTQVDVATFTQLSLANTSQLAAGAAVGELIREHWRSSEHHLWLDLHTLYPGIRELLLTISSPVAITSAKDEQSIRDVLAHHGLEHRIAAVYGSLTDKRPTLRSLAESAPVVFVDDNLRHVQAAGAINGVTALWATWGYHTAEDTTLAAQSATTAVKAQDLPALAAKGTVLTA